MILVVAALLTASTALGWHDAGHRATAGIAFEYLDGNRQLEIFAVLRRHPRYEEDFASQMPAALSRGPERDRARWALGQAAVWPDLMRDADETTRVHFHRSRWHYINLPVWLMPADAIALDGRLTHNMARDFSPPLRQNLNAVQALRGNLAIWRDSGANDAEKAVALCWILHLAGDLHQPLHSVALFSKAYFPEGDRGGNRIEVAWTPENNDLHAVWDGLPTHLPDLAPTTETLLLMAEDVVDDAAIDDWVDRHARLADRYVYTRNLRSQLRERLSKHQSPLVALDEAYLATARTIARRQVNLAGYRIARLIE